MVRNGLAILALGVVLLVVVPAEPVPTATPSSPQTPAAGPFVYLPLIKRHAPPQVVELVFAFSEVVQPEGDPRQLAVAFHSLTCVDARGNPVCELRFGTPEANELQAEGWFENEVDPDVGSFQWAGGPSGHARMQVEIPGSTEGLLLHVLSAKDGLWMDVTADGKLAATLRVDTYWHSGYMPHGPAVPEGRPDTEPTWAVGRYFPSLPTSEWVYAFPLTTTFASDYSGSWSPSWRVDDSYHDMMALTLVGMQGVINRSGPRVYFDWGEYWGNHHFWQSRVAEHVNVLGLDLDSLSAMRFLMRRYSPHFCGAVVYDPDVPDTINLATTLAGLTDRMMLAPEQLMLPGMDALLEEMEQRHTPDPRVSDLPTLLDFDCVIDLRELAQQQGWDATMEGQHDLYLWVFENLWPHLEQRIIGVISPGPPSAMEAFGLDSYWPLGMASRDLMVALRVPAIYLSPVEQPAAGLFHSFLESAPAPILISGGVAGYEEEVTALASSHGDWQAVISWPGAVLTSANLSVFSGVRPDVVRYEPEMDEDRIWATLGDDSVATMFSTDGDAIFYLMQRGFNESFGWADVQGQRFGWTINPTLAELAPVVWNTYVETRQEVSLLTGLSGAGYAYPQLMSTEELDSYLASTARYLDDTGLRVVRIDGRKGPPTEQLAGQYYQTLSGHGYLGAIYGYGGPQHGLGFDYYGTPAPISWPMFGIRSQNEISVAQQILDSTPGDDLFDIGLEDIGPGCQIEADPDAVNGHAALVPTTFATAPSCCLAVTPGTMSVPPGTYTVTFRMKVADHQDSEPFAAIYVGEQPGDWQTIVYQSLTPADFDQANEYQTFDLSFTLEHLTPDLEIRIDYHNGSTDLYVDTVRMVRSEGAALPVFANVLIALMLDPSEFEFQARAPERFTTAFEAGGGTVMTPDEFLAALNPEFMIEWATPMLGAGHPALAEASTLLGEERYLESLLAVREGLKSLPQQTFQLEIDQLPRPTVVEIRANSWIDDLTYDSTTSTISFRTHGPPEHGVEASMTIPAWLMGLPFRLSVDGQEIALREVSSAPGARLQFRLEPGAHRVRVRGARPSSAP